MFLQQRQILGDRKNQLSFVGMRSVPVLIFCSMLLLAEVFTLAQDKQAIQEPTGESWASFRNGDDQLGIAKTKLPIKPELLWKRKTIDGVVSTCAIANGRVYAPTLNGYLFSLDLKTGKEIWKYRSIESKDPDEFAAGFKAAPRVTKTTIYIGDEDGIVHAVNRATGKKRWSFQTDGEIAGCPAIVKGNVIVGSHDSFLYCLNAENGKVVWKFQTLDRINCSPAIIGKHAFVAGCDEHLRVIDIETAKEVSAISLESYLIASPAVKEDLLYVGTYSSEVVAVNWKKEKIVWTYKDPLRDFPYHSSCAVTDKFVLVGGQDKQMHCINRTTGKSAWVFKTKAQINSSPVVVKDHIYFGCNDGNLYGLKLQDGSEVWKYPIGKDVSASPAIGENCLVIGVEKSDGYLYCFGKP